MMLKQRAKLPSCLNCRLSDCCVVQGFCAGGPRDLACTQCFYHPAGHWACACTSRLQICFRSAQQYTTGDCLLCTVCHSAYNLAWHLNAMMATAHVQQIAAARTDTCNTHRLDCLAVNWCTCAQVVYLMSGCGSI